jgi:tetratricopeptide (TPR) repeat protein
MKLASPIQWSTITLLALLPPATIAQAAPAPSTSARRLGTLHLHRPVDRRLGEGQTDVYTVKASKGQFLHVVVEAKGVDLTVVLADPTGKDLLAADGTPSRLFGSTPASLITTAKGKYVIRVQKSARSSETGPYRIEVTELQQPTQQDYIRLQAETEFYAAIVADRRDGRQDSLQAIAGYQKAAALWHSLDDVDQEAVCLHRIGANDRTVGELQAGLKSLNEALPLWRAAGDRAGEAASFTGMSVIYSMLGDRQKALDYSDSALPLARAIGDRSGEALALQMLGIVSWERGDNENSVTYYSQAIAIRHAMGDGKNEANVLQGLGLVYRDLGENEKALDDFSQSLAMSRASGNRVGEAHALGNMAFVTGDNNNS